jgi:glycine oxidase
VARPSAGGGYELLRDAIILVPELADGDFAGARAGFRPGTPSNAPYLGELAPMGDIRVIVATGHYRNGIALTPITADAITELVLTGHAPTEIQPFAPGSEEPS